MWIRMTKDEACKLWAILDCNTVEGRTEKMSAALKSSEACAVWSRIDNKLSKLGVFPEPMEDDE